MVEPKFCEKCNSKYVGEVCGHCEGKKVKPTVKIEPKKGAGKNK